MDRFAITTAPLDLAALTALVTSEEGRAGGVVTFLGVVRGENLGRQVQKLDYEAYVPLAIASFERIAAEVAEEWPSVALALHHRTGTLAVGEASVAIVAASPHRAEAFGACRYAIERVKQISPIWKREYFADGDVWIEGATADPTDEQARRLARSRACA